jgi:hypothetical protein
MSCYLKPKELNEVNEIISEMPFKNLLKEIIIFSQGISYKCCLLLQVLPRGRAVNVLSPRHNRNQEKNDSNREGEQDIREHRQKRKGGAS